MFFDSISSSDQVPVRDIDRGSTAYNTLLPRRGLRPLATAGGEIGLGERRWTALRRPCGRLPGRRQTQNVRRNFVGPNGNDKSVVTANGAPPRSALRRSKASAAARPSTRRMMARQRLCMGARCARSPRAFAWRVARPPHHSGAFVRGNAWFIAPRLAAPNTCFPRRPLRGLGHRGR